MKVILISIIHTISGNTASNNTCFGISLSGDNGNISGNTSNNNGGGIFVQGNNGVVTQNTVETNNLIGFYVEGDVNFIDEMPKQFKP